ncbi:MAG: PilZ domain-containing protein [Candidatus Omnitrophota bacterium]
MENYGSQSPEYRQYTRLDSVFPVQFRLAALDGRSFLSDWLQGFTNNISNGGICLSVNKLSSGLAQILDNRQAKLSLEITIPIGGRPVDALARIAWVKETGPAQYLIGLAYENINAQDNARIMRYSLTKKLFAPVALSIIILLAAGVGLNAFINMRLTQDNKALVNKLALVIREYSIAKQKAQELANGSQDLQKNIQELQLGIRQIEEQKLKAQNEARQGASLESRRVEELNKLVVRLGQEKTSLEERLGALKKKESAVREEIQSMDFKRAGLEKANFDKMYQWIKIHQNPRTGLVMSFEGDGDIADWAFIYDQSLVALAYTYFGDLERAKKILDFFFARAKKQGGLFFNAYYANDGSPAEYTVHSGPNIWLGIAAMQYTKKSKENTYMQLAENIGQAIMDLQALDSESGIRGGPGLPWYSTEHNLDAFAFLNMLYRVTGKPQYIRAANNVLSWLARHTYDKSDIPISRGKGDSTIATDTYAWSIAAIGPERLLEIGMNPDMIMEFAEKNCSIITSYLRPEGNTIKVKGCDFASQKHLARGGVVSSEWTAQMIVSYKILSQFYEKKGKADMSRVYAAKADEYLSELLKMIISSPSPSGQGESCLPYATQDFVDTGHGWFTPKGKSTGSVAGTAYTIFAYYGYNPLELKD